MYDDILIGLGYDRDDVNIDEVIKAVRKNSQRIIDTYHAGLVLGVKISYAQPDEKKQKDIIEDICHKVARIDVINTPSFTATLKSYPEDKFQIKTKEYKIKDKTIRPFIPWIVDMKTIFFRYWLECMDGSWTVNFAVTKQKLYTNQSVLKE